MSLPLRRPVLAIAILAGLLTTPGLANADTHRIHHAAPPPLLRTAVNDLTVAAESREGYKRTSFKHWVDADANGCSARYEVLISEAIDPPTVGTSCTLTGGVWYSYYDDQIVTEAGKLDVDHLVPLAEAWDSGASTWDAQRREEYANYLERPEHLVAVTARSNRQKADKDPAAWMPIEQVRCRYITEWVAVKRHWQLSVDDVEKAKLAEVAQSCPNAPLPQAS
ncbi:HNH endonuclease family protein [Nonomuraea sp. NPDC001636]|uniref:HNH endonuclease family protein n=1 Tax=Nonomuraea sp. NPDC001636 TaxID=3154391 RepID=UPI0033299693